MVKVSFNHKTCYRLIPSKFPPIDMFDDVASQEEFEAVYNIQALTNPRLKNDLGNLNLVPKKQRPFGITGFNYAMAGFTHINPEGSRFSNGEYGVYYASEEVETAIAETKYHQENYFKNVEGLKFDKIVMRTLCTTFTAELVDIINTDNQDWYDPNNYTEPQKLGIAVKKNGDSGIWYGSVRNNHKACYALFTPKCIEHVVQGSHYEYVYNGSEISNISMLKEFRP